jgi:MerR family transcriptional regulator, light-induced transcriptional regulator
VAAPLFRRIGEAWHEGRLRPAHEHLASGVMRSVLHGLRSELGGGSEGPVVVVATPAGEQHEIGALLVAAAAAAQGWRVVYLGADLPAAEIGSAAAETGARVVAVSVVYTDGLDALVAEVGAIRAAVPSEAQVLLGGGLAAREASRFSQPGVEVVAAMDLLSERLQSLS